MKKTDGKPTTTKLKIPRWKVRLEMPPLAVSVCAADEDNAARLARTALSSWDGMEISAVMEKEDDASHPNFIHIERDEEAMHDKLVRAMRYDANCRMDIQDNGEVLIRVRKADNLPENWDHVKSAFEIPRDHAHDEFLALIHEPGDAARDAGKGFMRFGNGRHWHELMYCLTYENCLKTAGGDGAAVEGAMNAIANIVYHGLADCVLSMDAPAWWLVERLDKLEREWLPAYEYNLLLERRARLIDRVEYVKQYRGGQATLAQALDALFADVDEFLAVVERPEKIEADTVKQEGRNEDQG